MTCSRSVIFSSFLYIEILLKVALNTITQTLLFLKYNLTVLPEYWLLVWLLLLTLNLKDNQRLSRACIVHLVIKKNNWSYVKTMSCSGSHLGITINIKNTKFVKDLPMIDAQFRFIQCNSFREEYISVFSPYGSVLILWPVVAAILDFRSA